MHIGILFWCAQTERYEKEELLRDDYVTPVYCLNRNLLTREQVRLVLLLTLE